MSRESFDLLIVLPSAPSGPIELGYLSSSAKFDISPREYLRALIKELNFRLNESIWSGREVRSVYFSNWPIAGIWFREVRSLIQIVLELAGINAGAEVTLESEINNECSRAAAGLLSAGINRFSLRVKSFCPETLARLELRREPESAEKLIAELKSLGMPNLSLDLYYGLPGQTTEEFRFDLRKFLELTPDHLYFNQFRKQEELGKSLVRNIFLNSKYKPLPYSTLEKIHRVLSLSLQSVGYNAERIDSFSLPGKAPVFNLNDLDRDLLGIGAGALSRFVSSSGNRIEAFNCLEASRYVASLEQSHSGEKTRRIVPVVEQLKNYFSSELTRVDGLNLQELEKRFGISLKSLYPSLLDVLVESDYVTLAEERIRLTDKGSVAAANLIESFEFSMPVEIEVAKTPISIN